MRRLINFPIDCNDDAVVSSAKKLYATVCSALQAKGVVVPEELQTWERFVDSYMVPVEGNIYEMCVTIRRPFAMGFTEKDNVCEFLLAVEDTSVGFGELYPELDYSFTSMTPDASAGVLEGYTWACTEDEDLAKMSIYFTGFNAGVMSAIRKLVDGTWAEVECVQLFAPNESEAVYSTYAWNEGHFTNIFASKDNWDFIVPSPEQLPGESDEEFDARLNALMAEDYSVKEHWREGWTSERFAAEGVATPPADMVQFKADYLDIDEGGEV